MDNRLLKHIPLVRVQFSPRREEALRDKVDEVRDLVWRPVLRQKGLRDLLKVLPAHLVSRNRLDQRMPMKPAVDIDQLPAFSNKVGVPEIERTVEIPQIHVSQLLKDR